MSNIWGMSGKGHDASIVILKNNEIVFEHYSADKEHNAELIRKLKTEFGAPDLIIWYENPWKKMIRQWWDGHSNVYANNNIKAYLKSKGLNCKYSCIDHHRSHAGHLYDSPYSNAIVIVADSIGDIDCTSIWYNNKNIASINYPHSIGLFYSSMVQTVGLQPNKDESLFEKIANKNPIDYKLKNFLVNKYIVNHEWAPLFKLNLHKGINESISAELLAPAVQSIFEDLIIKMYTYWTNKLKCDNVIFSGGCAFNKSIRNKINIWVPNNPGDGGSARSCIWSYLNG